MSSTTNIYLLGDAHDHRHENHNTPRYRNHIDHELMRHEINNIEVESLARNEFFFFPEKRNNERGVTLENHLPWYLKHIEVTDTTISSNYDHMDNLNYELQHQSKYSVGKPKIFDGSFDPESKQVVQFKPKSISSQHNNDEHHHHSDIFSNDNEKETMILRNKTNEMCMFRHEYTNPGNKIKIQQNDYQKEIERNSPNQLSASHDIEQTFLGLLNSPAILKKKKEYPVFRGSFSYFDETNQTCDGTIVTGRFLFKNLNQFFSANVDIPIWSILLCMIILKHLRVFICSRNEEELKSPSILSFFRKIRWCKPTLPASFKYNTFIRFLKVMKNSEINGNSPTSEKSKIFIDNTEDQHSNILQDKKSYLQRHDNNYNAELNPSLAPMNIELKSKLTDTDMDADDESSKEFLPNSPSLSISSSTSKSSLETIKYLSLVTKLSPLPLEEKLKSIKDMPRSYLLKPDASSLCEGKYEHNPYAETSIIDKLQNLSQHCTFQARVENLTQLLSSTGLDRKSSLKLANSTLLRCLESEFKMIEAKKTRQIEKENEEKNRAKSKGEIFLVLHFHFSFS